MAREGHRLFAALYDRMNATVERRQALLSGARGEVGGGTGANLPHYRDVERVTLSEPDPFMREKLVAAGVPVEVSDAGAEALPAPDGAFDTVVSTLVLCTVPDQRAALREVRRVLRPGGRLLFIEHMRGEGRAARWQDRIELDTLERFLPPMPLSSLTPHVQGTATPRSGA